MRRPVSLRLVKQDRWVANRRAFQPRWPCFRGELYCCTLSEYFPSSLCMVCSSIDISLLLLAVVQLASFRHHRVCVLQRDVYKRDQWHIWNLRKRVHVPPLLKCKCRGSRTYWTRVLKIWIYQFSLSFFRTGADRRVVGLNMPMGHIPSWCPTVVEQHWSAVQELPLW